MKKYFFIVLAAISLAACSQKDEPKCNEFVQPVRTSSVTLNQLKQFNDSVFKTCNNVATKGVMRWLFVTSADIAGALTCGEAGAKVGGVIGSAFPGAGTAAGAVAGGTIGALIGGIGSSYGAYMGSKNFSSGIMPISIDDVKIAYCDIKSDKNMEVSYICDLDLPEECDSLYIVGVYHNLVLENLISQENEIAPLSNDISEPVEEQVEELSVLESAVLESSQYISSFNETVSSLYNNNYSFETIMDGTMVGSILQLYFQAINNITDYNSYTEFLSITNGYISIISQSSEISDIDKSILYMAFSVAVNSYRFWSSHL